jgi:acetamidase/formamidase
MHRAAFASLLSLVASVWMPASARAQTPPGTLFVPSRPETVVFGVFPIVRAPVLTVRSGQTVRIDTLSQRGATQDQSPIDYFGAFGIKPDEILKDVLDVWEWRRAHPEVRGGHILTGPIYVDGAEPGDTLEVQIVEITQRVPYGVNSTSTSAGVLRDGYATKPGDPPPPIPAREQLHVIRTGRVGGRDVVLFSDTIHVPLAPFMGTMAVAPRSPVVGEPGVRADGLQGSGPPGVYGGNLDFKMLTPGASLFLPVFHSGARFYVGDPHGAQGDGEVSGNALEQSLTGVFRFVVHKGKTITAPRAETATHYLLMGIDLDLDRAMRLATLEVVQFLMAEKKLSATRALSLASLGVDFHVAEAVDGTQVIVGKIPKALFLR